MLFCLRNKKYINNRNSPFFILLGLTLEITTGINLLITGCAGEYIENSSVLYNKLRLAIQEAVSVKLPSRSGFFHTDWHP